jgi:hypothetical protein
VFTVWLRCGDSRRATIRLVVGSPACQAGWVGTRGVPLEHLRDVPLGMETVGDEEQWVRPESGEAYVALNGMLEADAALGWDEMTRH